MTTVLPVLSQSIELPKRTRRNVRQSKGGCFTCRARRKKCGEEKPHCERCIKAGITCQGYSQLDVSMRNDIPLSGVSNDKAKISTTLCRSPSNPGRTRLFDLGLELLIQESRSGAVHTGFQFWSRTIPQISVMNGLVHAAVSSMGATYEAFVLRSDTSKSLEHCRALQHYKLALSKLRSELVVNVDDFLPIFLASVVLAAVEVLHNNLENASLHINGAFSLLQQHTLVRSFATRISLKRTRADAVESEDILATIDEGAYSFAQAMDIQVAAFALGSPPRLVPTPSRPVLQCRYDQLSETSLNFASARLLWLIHACFHFTSIAAPYKYVGTADVPSEIIAKQSHYIAQLLQWLCFLKERFARTAEHALLILRMHCLSTMIYVSTVLSAYEGAYDAHATSFREITIAASSILMQQPNETLATPACRFRILVSLAQPLYFSAIKCRDREIRREAISLLRLTGREGPWNSRVHAAVALRIAEIEEKSSEELQYPAKSDVSFSGATNGVLERARICGSGIEQETQSTPWPRSVTVSLSRCMDVDRMLSSPSTPWDAPEHWEIWSEMVVLD